MKIPNLPILQLDFCLEAKDKVNLPPYLGSTLRGSFGQNALKQAVCFVPHKDCDNCWFAKACIFQFIFNSPNFYSIPNDIIHPKLLNNEYFPSPFWLVPPKPQNTFRRKLTNKFENFNEYFKFNKYNQGDKLNFSIYLIGKAANYWNYVLVAVRLLAENGLGEEAKRTPFILKAAYANKILVFDNRTSRVLTDRITPKTLSALVKRKLKAISKSDSIEIVFETPTHLEKENKLLDTNPSFYKVVQKISERIEFLEFLYGGKENWRDYRPFLEKAKEITIKNESIQAYQYEQRSSDGGIKIRGVFLGKISFQGEQITKYLPLLYAGEFLNIGNDTTHGFGRFGLQF